MTRCVAFLKFMLDSNLVGEKEIDYLWHIYPMSDFRGRAVLQKVIGEVVTEMHH